MVRVVSTSTVGSGAGTAIILLVGSPRRLAIAR